MIDDFKDLFVRMVSLNPEGRPSIEEVLESSWVQGEQVPMTTQSEH